MLRVCGETCDGWGGWRRFEKGERVRHCEKPNDEMEVKGKWKRERGERRGECVVMISECVCMCVDRTKPNGDGDGAEEEDNSK